MQIMLDGCSPPPTPHPLWFLVSPLLGCLLSCWLVREVPEGLAGMSGAQVQQEIRIGGGQEEVDATRKVRPYPSGPLALVHLDRKVSQEGQALLLRATGHISLGQAQG